MACSRIGEADGGRESTCGDPTRTPRQPLHTTPGSGAARLWSLPTRSGVGGQDAGKGVG
jgi:hypothetical protein